MEVGGQEHLEQDRLQGGLEYDGHHTVLWLEDDERHFGGVAVESGVEVEGQEHLEQDGL